MLDKLQALEDKFLDLEARISDPDVISNQTEWQKCTKAHAKLADIVEVFREYKALMQKIKEDQEIVEAGEDAELVEMAEEELKELKPEVADYEERLTILLLPSDPNDDKDVIVEIRAAQAAMRLLFSPECYSVCIPVTPKSVAGAQRFLILTRQAWAALKK